ncbi:hypothetical protein MVEN_02299900 [Mycena venus]|uniref:Hydrophobin n=1 Tax=Mycena venus TaxID=2733690 RepID=A0A8H7CG42_9AGAR|nr:hypothetical protein MVEN_02299900 [Mycena venus]
MYSDSSTKSPDLSLPITPALKSLTRFDQWHQSSLASHLKRGPLTCEDIWNSINSSGNKSAVRSTCITFEASTTSRGSSRSFLAMRRPCPNRTLDAQIKPAHVLPPPNASPNRERENMFSKLFLAATASALMILAAATIIEPGTTLQCCASIVDSSTLITNPFLPVEFHALHVPIGVNCTATSVEGCGEITAICDNVVVGGGAFVLDCKSLTF